MTEAAVNTVEVLDPSFGYLVNNVATGKWQVYSQSFQIIAQGAERSYPLTKIADGCEKAVKYGVTQTVEISYDDFLAAKIRHAHASPVAVNTTNNVVQLHPVVTEHPLAKYSVTERFNMLDELVTVIAKREASALIITGTSGVGKTTSVTNTMMRLGLVLDMDLYSTDKENYISGCDYTILGSKTSARGLYETLFKYNGKLLIVDDCDSALHKGALDLLKCALDTTGRRFVCWNNAEGSIDENMPPKFEYTGRVIFVTNKTAQEIDPAIRSRAMIFDIRLTDAEKFERMQTILPLIEGYSDDVKADAIAYMEEFLNNSNRRNDLCMRALVKTLKLRASTANWRTLMDVTNV